MNRQVEVTWITLRTVANLLMVNARVPEVYIHFALMYTTDNIFLVISIKYLINNDDDLTTSHKLATGTKSSVSHLRVLFCPYVVQKATAHVETNMLNMRHQAQKRVSLYLCWDSRASKRISCICTQYKEDNVFE